MTHSQSTTLGTELVRIGAALRMHPDASGHLEADPALIAALAAIIGKISNRQIALGSFIDEYQSTIHRNNIHGRTVPVRQIIELKIISYI